MRNSPSDYRSKTRHNSFFRSSRTPHLIEKQKSVISNRSSSPPWDLVLKQHNCDPPWGGSQTTKLVRNSFRIADIYPIIMYGGKDNNAKPTSHFKPFPRVQYWRRKSWAEIKSKHSCNLVVSRFFSKAVKDEAPRRSLIAILHTAVW